MKQDKFSLFIPIEIEKGKSKDPKDRYENMRFKGVASNPNTGLDAAGEWLDPRGFDLNDFLSTGTINYHHLRKKSPAAIIAEPIAAKITQGGELYVEGKLWKSSPLARDVYDVAEVMEKDSETRRMGFSIEGIPVERDPNNEKRILKARITNLAITPAPKNKGTRMELIKGGLDEIEYETQEGSEYLVDVIDNGIRYQVTKDLEIIKGEDGEEELEKAGEGSRGGKVIGHTKSGKPIYETQPGSGRKRIKINSPLSSHSQIHGKTYDVHNESEVEFASGKKKHYHIVDEKGNKHKIREDFAELQKAMVAGHTTGTDTNDKLTTGESVKEESLEGSAKETQTKKKKNKRILSKGEIYNRIFSSFSIDNIDQAKKIYQLIQKVQQHLDHGENNRRSS